VRSGTQQTVSGIGGASLRILGYINLVITAGNKDIEVPFAITREGHDRIIVGSPGLRALGFSLRSPLFKGIDFLQSPTLRREEAMKKFAAPEANRLEIEDNLTRAPKPAEASKKIQRADTKAAVPQTEKPKKRGRPRKDEEPPVQATLPVPPKRSRKDEEAPVQTTPPVLPKRTTRSSTKNAQKADPAEGFDADAGGGTAGNKGAKPAGGVDKAKSTNQQHELGKCEEELKKDALHEVLAKNEHVEIDDNGEIVPAEQVFRESQGAAPSRLN